MVSECFAERARDAAKDVDIVVTNHALLAIDAFEGRQMLPEHDVLVVDEAHELVDRVTVGDHRRADRRRWSRRAAKRAGRLAETEPVTDAADPAPGILDEVARGPAARHPRHRSSIALARVRDTCRARADRAQAAPAPRTTTAPGRWPGPPSTRSSRSPSGCSRSASSTSAWVSRDPRRGSGAPAWRR